MKDLLFASVFALILVLFLVDQFIATAGSPETPTDCSEEDVPIVPIARTPTMTWWLDKDGKIHGSKTK